MEVVRGRGRLLRSHVGDFESAVTEGLGVAEEVADAVHIHNYLPEDVVLLKGKIRELENFMLTCNARGNTSTGFVKSYGSYLCLKEFEWNLRKVLG